MFLRDLLVFVLLLALQPATSQLQDEEFYKQLEDLDQMISLVRNARSVPVDVEEEEDDEEIMAVLNMVDLDDSSNVEAVADVMKTLDGGKQLDFLMTKFMVRRGRKDEVEDNSAEPAENNDEDVGQEQQEDEEEEEEPMLSRQRRFISDMFSYFTGDSEPEPEPENPHYPQPWPQSEPEPSYPVKPNQHRHYRSPYPEPEPQGIAITSSFGLFNFLFIMKVPILLCCMKVRGTWAMTTTCRKRKISQSITITREAVWTSCLKRSLSFT